MQPIRLLRSFFTVGAWTMVSRLLGFIRDILIASIFGSGPIAQAFLVAFSLPNMFRRFFAEGAMNTAFVPLFSKKLESNQDPIEFAQSAFSALAWILIALTLVASIAMPWLVLAMASGFAGDSRFDIAVAFGRVCFPYILFISLAALASGVLNASGRFAAAAAAPVLLNIILVFALVFAEIAGLNTGWSLVIAVPIGGIAQLGLVWWAAKRAGFPLFIKRPAWSPQLTRLAVIAGPAALAGGVMQINLLVGRQVASFFDGAIAWVSYADRLYQLPLGVIGIAIGIVLLPDMSRRLRKGDEAGVHQVFNQSMWFAMLFTIPATVAFLVLPGPIVATLFERGAFDTEDTRATSVALMVYAAGLPAFVAQKVLQPLYFAREDTRTPLRYALIAMLVNAVMAIGLAPIFGFVAAAWGTTLAAWAMAFLLWRGSRSMGPSATLTPMTFNQIARVSLAASLMGTLLLLIQLFGPLWIALPGTRIFGLAVLISAGALSFFVFAYGLGALDLSAMKRALKR